MNDNCKICGSDTSLMYRGFPGYQEGSFFNIHFCKNCLTSFSLPRIDAKDIYNFIYNNSEKIPGYNRYIHYHKTIKSEKNPMKYLTESEEVYWGTYEALKVNVKHKKDARILEIGSGLGYLTYALRNENYNVTGLDISKEAVNQANEKFGEYYICEDLFEHVKSHIEFYDFVILTEVIEHVDNPKAFIEAIKKILKKGGCAILTTPNKSIFPEDIIWDTEAPPIHQWWLGEDSMKYIASNLNLDASFVNFKEYYRKYPGEYNHNKARANQLIPPMLTADWKILRDPKSKTRGKLKRIYKAFVKSILIMTSSIKIVYFRLKLILKPATILYGERGKILCVVLKKKE